MTEELSRYASDSFLQKTLDDTMGFSEEGVAINIFYKGEIYSASINGFDAQDPVQVGCIAKSLTATLIGIAQLEGRLKIDMSVVDFFSDLSLNVALIAHLRETKIYHLLNHSNGFDHSLLDVVPKNIAGMIDSQIIFDNVEKAGVISISGKVFNYNSIGPWLAAAILEYVYEKPYAELLNDLLFKPLGIKLLNTSIDNNICPSIGLGLRLSAADLIKFACLHLEGDFCRPKLLGYLCELRSQFSFPIPHWSPAGERCYPSWFDFGGSFGQLGYGDESAGVIRFLPEHDMAIAVTSTHQKLANTMLGILFKDILSGFERSLLPQLLSQDKWAKINISVYIGIFENGRYRLLIDTAANGSLRGKLYRKYNDEGIIDTEPYIKRYFKAAANDFFIASQPEQIVCPILAFSHPDQNGQFQIISTSLYAFSRIASQLELCNSKV